jgi:hypothetical protein
MSQITSVKRVKNNSLQAEFIDEVQLNKNINVLQRLNSGDSRFSSTKSPRHAWFPVTIPSLEELGVSAAKLAEIAKLEMGQSTMIELADPTIDGHKLVIQVEESTTPFDEYQRDNYMKAAKQLPITEDVANNRTLAAGRNLSKYIGGIGYFLDKDGRHIFSRTRVTVESQRQHSVIEAAAFIPEQELDSWGATLAAPTKVAASTFAEKGA